MEMSVFTKRRGLRTIVEWTSREGNKEADELANGITQRFRPELEVKLKEEELEWYILPRALEIGAQAENEHQRGERFRIGRRSRGRGGQTNVCE